MNQDYMSNYKYIVFYSLWIILPLTPKIDWQNTEFKEAFIWFVMPSEFFQFNRGGKGYAGRSSRRDVMEAFR